MPDVDMSPHAVSRRLQHVSDLRDVCLLLAGPRLKKPWGAIRPDYQRPAAHEPRTSYDGQGPEHPKRGL